MKLPIRKAIDEIKTFSRVFVERPRFAMVIAIVLTMAGVLSMTKLPITQYPQLTPPEIRVTYTYPGANAREVMNTVATPIEYEVNGVDDMIYMSSESGDDGSYSLTVCFEVESNRDMDLVKVQNRLSQAEAKLPTEVKQLGGRVRAQSTDFLGFLTLLSPNGTHTTLELSDYAYQNIQPRLLRIAGVGEAQIYGPKLAVRVWLDPQKLTALGLDAEKVVAAIRRQNIQAPLGSVGSAPAAASNGRVISLISKGRINKIEEFERIVICSDDRGGIVRLSDVGRVEYGLQAYAYNSFVGDVPCVQMYIYLLPGADGEATMKRIKDELSTLQKHFPSDLCWEMSYDATNYMYSCMKTILTYVALSVLLVFIFARICLGCFRDAFVLTVFVPLSLLPAFAAVAVQGMSFNIITCLAFAPAVGLSVFFTFSVCHRVRMLIDMGLGPIDAASVAIDSLTPSLTVAVLLVVVVFIPLGCINGLTGVVYRLFSTVFTAAAVFSFVNAIVSIPSMCARLMCPRKRGYIPFQGGGVFIRTFIPLVDYFIAHPILAVVAFILIALISGASLRKIPTTLIPSEDTGAIRINCRLAEGSPISATSAICRRLASKIATIPGVKCTNVLCGESDFGGSGENQGLILAILDDWSERRDAHCDSQTIISRIDEFAEMEPAAKIDATLQVTVPGMGWTTGVGFVIESHGDADPMRLAQHSHRIAELVNQSPLFDLGACGYSADTPRLRIKVDRDKCELMGVPLSSLFSTLQYYLGSIYVNDVNVGTQVNRVVLEADWSGRATCESVKDLFVRSTTGKMVPLGALVAFQEELGPRVIYRRNQYVDCGINAIPGKGVSTGDAIAEVESIIDDNLPLGYSFEWNGMTFHEMRRVGNVGLMAALSVFLLYSLLVARFESLILPLTLLLPSVGSVFGVGVGLDFLGGQLALCSRIALILVVVLGVMAAVPILEMATMHRNAGFSPVASTRVAFSLQLSSVVAILLAVIISTLPLCFSSGACENAIQSLGMTVASAALGQLFVGLPILPVLVYLAMRIRGRHGMKRFVST